MGRITSSIGLVTGVPIQDTVDQLIAIQAQPRNLLVSRTDLLAQEQSAIAALNGQLLSLQFQARQLKSTDIFDSLQVNSSNLSKLSVIQTGTPVAGSYRFTPIRTAQTQQLLSSAFTADDTPLGEGTFSVSRGGSINEGINLAQLNGGTGIQRGKLRITDRSGASAEIDLSFARTVDDVLAAVNSASAINVQLETHGDRFRLVDLTGQSTSNLRVQEVGGTTAADLGLVGIDVAATEVDGADVVRLYDQFALAGLNDGRGLQTFSGLPELKFTFRDGSDSLQIDLQRLPAAAQQSQGTRLAANGESAQLRFTATEAGGEFDGYTISYVNEDIVTAGNEIVEYDTQAKTLVFRIDEGLTTADHIIAALAAHPQAGADFTAQQVSGPLLAEATTNAANGPRAELNVRALQEGPDFDGFAVGFINNATAGNESVTYSPNLKEIVFSIEEGVTTAEDLVAVAAADPLLAADFAVTTNDFFATATTTAANGIDAQLQFTAVGAGSEFDDVTIVFEDNAGVQQGGETVVFDETPGDKKLVFQIDAGNTTADDIVAALEANAQVNGQFSASLVGAGTGLVDVTDTAVTSGGVADGLISTLDSAVTSGGAAGLIDTSDRVISYGGAAKDERTELTLGDLLETINEAGQGRLLAEFSPDGDGIRITDLTDDLGGTFSISSLFGSPLLEDLGLDGSASGGVITSTRLQGGLKTTLIESLNGGSGLNLGTIQLTDRSGQSVNVDLSAAATLDDVIDTLNESAETAGVQIKFGINDSRNGVAVTDTSGQTGSPLVVANADATNSADQLGIAVSDSVSQFEGANLNRQSISETTLLSSLNGGLGVPLGLFRVTNSAGIGTSVVLTEEIQTVGELIEAINDRAIDVVARINDEGDGIILVDEADGSGSLIVTEINFGSTAAGLHLLGTAKEVDIGGETKQVIHGGGQRFDVDLDDDDSLDDLVTKTNDLNSGLLALKIGDGSLGNPFRISLLGQLTGDDANLQIDTAGVDFSFQETVRAQDSLLLLGSPENAGAGVLVSSKSSQFSDILPGAQLTVRESSTDPVTISVSSSDTDVVQTAQAFVDNFNRLRDSLDQLTFFDETDNTVGILHGSLEALRVETELADLLTGRFIGVGSFQSLEAVGIGIGDDGKLSLDTAKLSSAFASDPEGLKQFFTDPNGVGEKFDRLIETLAGEQNSLLVNRAKTLADKVNVNVERVAFLDLRLEARREQLLEQFVRMELTIGKLQNDLIAIQSLQILQPLSISSNSNG